MRKLCLLAMPVLIGVVITSCSSQAGTVAGDSRSASIRVIVSPGGNDLLRSEVTVTR
jgi:hypothetical protein